MALSDRMSSSEVSDWTMASFATTLPGRMEEQFQQGAFPRGQVQGVLSDVELTRRQVKRIAPIGISETIADPPGGAGASAPGPRTRQHRRASPYSRRPRGRARAPFRRLAACGQDHDGDGFFRARMERSTDSPSISGRFRSRITRSKVSAPIRLSADSPSCHDRPHSPTPTSSAVNASASGRSSSTSRDRMKAA